MSSNLVLTETPPLLVISYISLPLHLTYSLKNIYEDRNNAAHWGHDDVKETKELPFSYHLSNYSSLACYGGKVTMRTYNGGT